MRIVVIYKWAANPQEAAVDGAGKVDWSRAKAGISEYDLAAIELARNIADAAGAELIGVSAGQEDVAAAMSKKAALSRGLDRLVLVSSPRLAEAGTTFTGLVLAEAIRQTGDVDLVVAGDSSIDIGAQLVPAVVAGALGWPVLNQVTGVTVADGLAITRNYRGGTQRLHCAGPLVVAAAPDAVVPRVPGMKDILAAGKRPSEVLDIDLDAFDTSSVEVVGRARPATAQRRLEIIDGADASAAAATVVGGLRAAGVL